VSIGALLARVGAAGVLLLAPWLPGPAADAGAARGAAPRYRVAADLDVRPQIMSHVMPEYPRNILSGTKGRVVLDLFVSAKGTLDRIHVVKAEPPGRFEQAARQAFAGARYSPGLRKGKPVASRLRIEVSFGD
jgi:protein TonB